MIIEKNVKVNYTTMNPLEDLETIAASINTLKYS